MTCFEKNQLQSSSTLHCDYIFLFEKKSNYLLFRYIEQLVNMALANNCAKEYSKKLEPFSSSSTTKFTLIFLSVFFLFFMLFMLFLLCCRLVHESILFWQLNRNICHIIHKHLQFTVVLNTWSQFQIYYNHLILSNCSYGITISTAKLH